MNYIINAMSNIINYDMKTIYNSAIYLLTSKRGRDFVEKKIDPMLQGYIDSFLKKDSPKNPWSIESYGFHYMEFDRKIAVNRLGFNLKFNKFNRCFFIAMCGEFQREDQKWVSKLIEENTYAGVEQNLGEFKIPLNYILKYFKVPVDTKVEVPVDLLTKVMFDVAGKSFVVSGLVKAGNKLDCEVNMDIQWPLTFGGRMKLDMGFIRGNLEVKRRGISIGGAWTYSEMYGIFVQVGHDTKPEEVVTKVECLMQRGVVEAKVSATTDMDFSLSLESQIKEYKVKGGISVGFRKKVGGFEWTFGSA